MGSNIFFGLFRRRGFTETMEVLNSFPNNEAVQSIFFEKLISVESYPNTYFRVKKDLLDHKLIGYKLNEKNEKVIFLTDKGKDIWSKVQEIESILISN